MLSKLERVKSRRRVAIARGRAEGIARLRVKLSLLRRAKKLAESLHFGEPSNMCTCGRIAAPHVHVFGSMLPVSHLATKAAFIKRLVSSHTFRRAGEMRTWRKGGVTRDLRDHYRRRARSAVDSFVKGADKLTRDRERTQRARTMLSSDCRGTQISACVTLGINPDTLPPRDIWRQALDSRKSGKRGKRSKHVKRAQPGIQVYRG